MIGLLLERMPEGHLPQLILRMAGAASVSFLVVMLLTPKFIRWLLRKKIGDRPEFDHAHLNELTRHKSNTPTMGGLLIAGAIFAGVVLFADVFKSFYVQMALVALVWLAALGAVDDYYKLRRYAGAESRDGLKMWQKILFQIALGVVLGAYVSHYGQPIDAMKQFYWPVAIDPIPLSVLAFMVMTVLVMVGSSNAVNLTDGMDGLAGGCMLIVSAVFLTLAWLAGNQDWANALNLPHVPGAAELAVICAAMMGACLGFLWYNCNPAQVFMGDTGSLPLGGLIGYVAVVTRQELMLLIAGGVFVSEAVSVLLQVGYFKASKGKRLFRCAPIHHHFHLNGWSEQKVVVRFWLVSLLLAAVAIATLKLR